MPELHERHEIEALLRRSRRIAVLGISSKESKAGYYVPEYLNHHGYEIYGVNPNLEGTVLFGHTVVASLADLDTEIDMVDVFRRPNWLPAHLPELLALAPSSVWLQLGVRHDQVAQALQNAGIDVVQDRCTMADHRRWVRR